MTKEELAKKIYEISHLTGEFKLRSGKVSNEYFDKYLFESNPKILREIANQLANKIPENTEILAGLETGGIPIATALSLKTNLPAIFVRKKAKEYGTCKLAEGVKFENKQVCIIEDVVTTGGQVIESVKKLRKKGANIDTVLCVILRDELALDLLKEESLTLIPLFTMNCLKNRKEKEDI